MGFGESFMYVATGRTMLQCVFRNVAFSSKNNLSTQRNSFEDIPNNMQDIAGENSYAADKLGKTLVSRIPTSFVSSNNMLMQKGPSSRAHNQSWTFLQSFHIGLRTGQLPMGNGAVVVPIDPGGGLQSASFAKKQKKPKNNRINRTL